MLLNALKLTSILVIAYCSGFAIGLGLIALVSWLVWKLTLKAMRKANTNTRHNGLRRKATTNTAIPRLKTNIKSNAQG